jgi:hypothetical protein
MPVDTSSAMNKRKQDLRNEITHDIKNARDNARMNHLTSVFMMVIALLCSVAAAVSGLIAKNPQAAGLLAILPPLIAFIVTNLKLDGKACWYFNKVNAFEGLRSRLLYELPEHPSADNIAAISRERAGVVDNMEKFWDQHLRLDWSVLTKPPVLVDFRSQSTESSATANPAKQAPEAK